MGAGGPAAATGRWPIGTSRRSGTLEATRPPSPEVTTWAKARSCTSRAITSGSVTSNAGDRFTAASQHAPFGGPVGQLVAVRQLQLAQHRRHVALHRLGRDPQLPGDLLVGVAPGDEAQDLALPGGQLVELRVEARRRGRPVAGSAKASSTKPASRGRTRRRPRRSGGWRRPDPGPRCAWSRSPGPRPG